MVADVATRLDRTDLELPTRSIPPHCVFNRRVIHFRGRSEGQRKRTRPDQPPGSSTRSVTALRALEHLCFTRGNIAAYSRASVGRVTALGPGVRADDFAEHKWIV